MRARILASGLPAFGWNPIVVAVKAECYEEAGDEKLLALCPPEVRLERVSAWPARVCRPLGIGDISLRGQSALRRRVGQIVQREGVDVIFCSVLPGYTSLIGAWAKRRFGVPFVLDYQDPWVSEWGACQPVFSKAGLAHRLATWLEPGAVKEADALTAVSDGTLETLRSRKLIRDVTPVEIIPIGADSRDHLVAREHGTTLIPCERDAFHVAYLGTLTSRMLPALEAFCSALRIAEERTSTPIVLHLIGTSAQPGGEDVHGLDSIIARSRIRSRVRVHPARISYLDALRTMQNADLLLLIGSTDAHYTASKIFPYWLSGKPMFALFHESSTVAALSADLGGVSSVLYNDARPPAAVVGDVAERLGSIVSQNPDAVPPRNEANFSRYSSKGIAQRYARLFDRVSERADVGCV